MFALHQYLDKIYQIKWYMKSYEAKALESLMQVEFEDKNTHYTIKKVYYTYVDILLALETIDFEIIKKNNEIELKILKM